MAAFNYLRSVADKVRDDPSIDHGVIAEMIGLGLSALAGEQYMSTRTVSMPKSLAMIDAMINDIYFGKPSNFHRHNVVQTLERLKTQIQSECEQY